MKAVQEIQVSKVLTLSSTSPCHLLQCYSLYYSILLPYLLLFSLSFYIIFSYFFFHLMFKNNYLGRFSETLYNSAARFSLRSGLVDPGIVLLKDLRKT